MPAPISRRLRIAAIVLRSLIIVMSAIVVWRASLPQSETIWTIYETRGDLLRLVLGIGACLWMLIQLFILPNDEAAYRIWLYAGLVIVPFGLLLVIWSW